MEDSKLKEAKEKAFNEISIGTRINPYDRYDGENAYWTMCDCHTLIGEATTLNQINTSLKIFRRYKFHLKSKKG